MPIYNANILPGLTGYSLGQPGQLWDIYARNINFTGTLTGNLNTGINNSWKNTNVTFGGINIADSLMVPISHYSGATDVTNYERYYKRGDSVNPSLDITAYGEVRSYGLGYAPNAVFSAYSGADAQPKWMVDSTGALQFGVGGVVAPDVAISHGGAANYVQLTIPGGGWANLDLGFAHFRTTAGAPFQVDSATVIPNLNASLLNGSDWTNPPTIGASVRPTINANALSVTGQISSSLATGTAPLSIASTTPVANLTVQHISDVTFHSTVTSNGDGAKFVRLNLGAMAAGYNSVVVTFTTAFADSNYTISVSVFDPTASGTPGVRVLRQIGQTAASATILLYNDDSVAHTGCVLHLVAYRNF